VGAKLLPNGDFIKIDTSTVYALQSSSQLIIPGSASSARLLVGKLNTTECWGVIQFPYLPDTIRSLSFVSATLQLRTLYHFGDSSALFSLDIHKITKEWSSDSLTIDSLKAAGFYDTKASGSGRFVPLGDTVTISISLDSAMIRTWGTVSDSIVSNFGILLRPTNSGVVKGFGTVAQGETALRPKLTLVFRDAFGALDTLALTAAANRFVVTGPPTQWAADSTRIYVQNGFAYRGTTDFDVSNLPAHTAIHKATLELTLDASQSLSNYFTADSLNALFVSDDGVTLPYIEGTSQAVQVGSAKVYRFEVGQFVQRWLRGAKSRRIVIAGYDESGSLDRFVFYGAGSNRSLRPKLTIYHSLIR
jgi:hypothetical protein